jgi:dUTPase
MAGKIKFLKTREVKSPSRANRYDAGIDFYVPEFTSDFMKDLKAKNPDIDFNNFGIYLKAGERVLIPSGIHCQMFDNDRALIAANKSGVATKNGLVFGAQVVDYEYQGEIHLSLIYTGHGTCEILPGQKILQFLEMPIFTSEIEIFENLIPSEFYEKETTRGTDGFGSTDKK